MRMPRSRGRLLGFVGPLFLCFFVEECLSVMYALGECEPLRITHYDANVFGSSCQLGRGTNTGPGYLTIAAPNYPFRVTARPCGVCYEVTGPMGSVRVMVVSGCPDCDQDMIHFDLSDETFPMVVDQDQGLGRELVSYREISCDVWGPVKLRWKEGSGIWSFYIVVFNHAVGVESLEINQGTGYEDLPRETWNEFRWNNGQVTLPFTLRVTSWYGDQIEMTVNYIAENQIFDFSRQFDVPINNSLAGECCEPIDIHSTIYDDQLKGCWADWSTFVENIQETSNPHTGSYCISAALPPWQEFGYGCNSEARVDQWEVLQFWARTDLTSYDGLDIRISSGKYDQLEVISVTGLTDVWQMFEVTIASRISFFSFSKVSFKNEDHNSVTLYVDDIVLIRADNAPDLAQCAPGVFGGPPDPQLVSVLAGVIGGSLAGVLLVLVLFATILVAFSSTLCTWCGKTIGKKDKKTDKKKKEKKNKEKKKEKKKKANKK